MTKPFTNSERPFFKTMTTNLLPFLFSAGLLGASLLTASPLNVKDFGAIGDGVADDTVAIQKALNYIEADSKANRIVYVNDYGNIPGWGIFDGPSRELFFPAGRYKISKTLVGGSSFTLSGENGSVIFTEKADLILFYFEKFFRGSVRNLTFRGGKNHLYYWSANQDTASFVIEDCHFENSSEYALTSRSYFGYNEIKKRREAMGPFIVTWSDDGIPTLAPGTWESTFPNSTKCIITRCFFNDCAGGSDIRADGVFTSNCQFVSKIPQTLTPFISTWTSATYDCQIMAAIPQGFTGAFISGCGMISNITARSSTEYGAPLLIYSKPFRSQKGISHPECIIIENSTVAAANSPSNAIAHFPMARPVQLTMRNNHEANGHAVKAVKFDIIPQNDHDLLEDQFIHGNPNIPLPSVKDSHGYVFHENGKEVDITLPPKMMQFLKKDLPKDFVTTFPQKGSVLPPKDYSIFQLFDAGEYGISHKAADTDYDNLQKLFDAAGHAANPLVLLPGRRFDLPNALRIPEKCVIKGEGRTVLHAANGNNGILTVSGDAISMEVRGVIFNGGTQTISILGAGEVRFDDCFFYDNRTAILTRQSLGKKLVADVFGCTFYSPVIVENHAAIFRVTDSWISLQATLNGAGLRNMDDGTLIATNICGVPVIFGEWCDRPNWPYGKHVYWVENHGTFRSSFFRYGAEFNGAPSVDNYGAGRVLIEGAFIAYWYPTGDHVLLRNENSTAQFGIGSVSSFGIIGSPKNSAFCKGIAPNTFWVSNYPHLDKMTIFNPDGTQSLMQVREP